MATKKDLVEAYSFSRRRLVTAFVSGAPGGREVEPARPGRMIVGGVALAVLLIAGAAVAGALKPRADVEWDDPGLVTDDHGALYIILDKEEIAGQPQLRSVINVTSAQLILGAEEEARNVPTEDIADRKKGSPIGILGAPATVPGAPQLINDGWTSCTGTGFGIKTDVSDEGRVRSTPDLGLVVRGAQSDQVFLIAEAKLPGLPTRAYRYPMPDDNDSLYTALNVSPTDEITVPERWLELFPPGGALDETGLGLADWGRPADLPGYPAGARVGDWFDSNGTLVALTKQGAVELSPFAAAVLRNTPGRTRPPRQVDDLSGLDILPEKPYEAAQWPEDLPADSPAGDEQVCGVLETAEDEAPAVRLATTPEGAASAEDVDVEMREVTVQSGHGAVVRSADWITDAGGTVHLIDDRGFSYPLAGDIEVTNLGYAGVPALVVPDVWNKLFDVGPELSRDAALCPPATAGTSNRAQTCS